MSRASSKSRGRRDRLRTVTATTPLLAADYLKQLSLIFLLGDQARLIQIDFYSCSLYLEASQHIMINYDRNLISSLTTRSITLFGCTMRLQVGAAGSSFPTIRAGAAASTPSLLRRRLDLAREAARTRPIPDAYSSLSLRLRLRAEPPSASGRAHCAGLFILDPHRHGPGRGTGTSSESAHARCVGLWLPPAWFARLSLGRRGDSERAS